MISLKNPSFSTKKPLQISNAPFWDLYLSLFEIPTSVVPFLFSLFGLPTFGVQRCRMGFHRGASRAALEQCSGELERAVELMLTAAKKGIAFV